MEKGLTSRPKWTTMEETSYMILVLQEHVWLWTLSEIPNVTPRKLRTNSLSDELYDAGGKSLGCIGVNEMDFEVLGRKIKHLVRVLQHVTEDIIGIDFIKTHHLWYDPVHR